MSFDKEQQKEYMKEYNSRPKNKAKRKENRDRPENKAKRKEYMKKYYAENEDHIREKAKKNYDDNKERYHIQNKEYRSRPSSKQRKKEYEKENPERVKKWKRTEYLKNIERYRSSHKTHRETVLKEYKKIVISHYSKNKMECKLCKVKGLDFLNIDHIEGRKKMGHSGSVRGIKLYAFLKKNNFPEGYQVLCWNCNNIKHIVSPRTLSQNIINVHVRQRNYRKKFEVMSYYSQGKPKCNCCNYSESLNALTIDHKKGRKNTEHRRGMIGSALYDWLIKNNYPQDYQVLCWNCNSAKSDKSVCPHQLDKMKN